jgi:hypothetical protein
LEAVIRRNDVAEVLDGSSETAYRPTIALEKLLR